MTIIRQPSLFSIQELYDMEPRILLLASFLLALNRYIFLDIMYLIR